MKTMRERKQKNATAVQPQASAGLGGLSIPPPTYGMQALDHPVSQPTPGAPAVVQRIKWRFWQRDPEPDPYEGFPAHERDAVRVGNAIAREEHQHRRRQAVIGGPSYDYATPRDIETSRRDYDAHHAHSQAVTQTPQIKSRVERVGAVGSGVSKLGTFGTHVGQVVGNDTLGTAGRLASGGGAGIGVLGSLLDAGVETRDILTSDERGGDKAVRGVGVLGSLANATNSGASGVQQVSGVLSGASAFSNIAGAVAAPAALAKGSADVISGVATGGMAHYRSNRLQEIQDRSGSGVARFAQESQWNKAKSNYGKAFGGALGVAGGALLLAAGLSNPIGWGLMALGGLVGLGVAGYRMYKKHQQGKQLLESGYSDALERNHVAVPSNDDLGPGGLSNIFKTKSMRRQEIVRGRVGMALARNEQSRFGLTNRSDGNMNAVASHLGVSELEDGRQRLLEGQRDEDSVRRARSYARALDY